MGKPPKSSHKCSTANPQGLKPRHSLTCAARLKPSPDYAPEHGDLFPQALESRPVANPFLRWLPLLVSFLLLFFSIIASGQTLEGSVSGMVTDSSGARVAGAKV